MIFNRQKSTKKYFFRKSSIWRTTFWSSTTSNKSFWSIQNFVKKWKFSFSLAITVVNSIYLYSWLLSIPNNSGNERLHTITRFDPIVNSWTKLGNLEVARNAHAVIQVDNEFIVVGGHRQFAEDEPTESCKLNGKLMTCTTREPSLSTFAADAGLMLIP